MRKLVKIVLKVYYNERLSTLDNRSTINCRINQVDRI